MGIVNFSIPKELVLKIVKDTQMEYFVESGTYKGETCFWAAKVFRKVFTIEIDPVLSKEASNNYNNSSNIEFLVGNSKDVLPGLVRTLSHNTFFWLDGHWCPGGGGKEEECPLLDELKAISVLKTPTIFIDDARCFLGPLPPPHNSKHWPKIDEIFSLLKEYFPSNTTTIQDDIIMCVPNEVRNIIDEDWIEKFDIRFGVPEGKESPVIHLIGRIRTLVKSLLQ